MDQKGMLGRENWVTWPKFNTLFSSVYAGFHLSISTNKHKYNHNQKWKQVWPKHKYKLKVNLT